MKTRYCLRCSKKIPWAIGSPCPYCGYIFPGEENLEMPNIPLSSAKENKKESSGLTDEEALATGLYPKDENYKMSMISRILGGK